MKKALTFFIVTIVVGTIIFLIINNFVGKEESGKNSKKSNNLEEIDNSVVIDYKMYQELRSEVHENETFAIMIMKKDDEISNNFKREILYSFKNRKTTVYEIDVNELSKVEQSGLTNDITEIMSYDEPTIVIPSLIISKKGKIVYKQAGLKYSTDLIEDLDKNKIE